jgi:hypothetical protein
MNALQSHKLIESKCAEAHPPSAVFHATPRQRGIQVIASVEENCTTLKRVDDVLEFWRVGGVGSGPNRRGEAVFRVIHELDSFFIRIDLAFSWRSSSEEINDILS